MICLITNIKSPNEEHITKAPLIRVDFGQRCNEIMKAQRTQKKMHSNLNAKVKKWIIGLLACNRQGYCVQIHYRVIVG